MNNILAQLNSVPMYAICGGIIAFVAVVCVIFLVRSYRAGLAIGIDPARMKRAITSSATFSVLPSVGILLGVISAAVMALFVYLSEKKNMAWLESFSIAGSMLIGMAAAVLVRL